jgi:hypothetical protein
VDLKKASPDMPGLSSGPAAAGVGISRRAQSPLNDRCCCPDLRSRPAPTHGSIITAEFGSTPLSHAVDAPVPSCGTALHRLGALFGGRFPALGRGRLCRPRLVRRLHLFLTRDSVMPSSASSSGRRSKKPCGAAFPPHPDHHKSTGFSCRNVIS